MIDVQVYAYNMRLRDCKYRHVDRGIVVGVGIRSTTHWACMHDNLNFAGLHRG